MTEKEWKDFLYKSFTMLDKSYYKSFGTHLFRKEDKDGKTTCNQSASNNKRLEK